MSVDLGRSSPRGNGRGAARCAALGAAALALAGCSLSFPLPGLAPDDAPTGSIDRAAALMPPALDREDLRRAEAAMAVALDPQGEGARVAWNNPRSGARGAFAAAGPPFADQDRVCRNFSGEVAAAGEGARRLAGSACRGSDGAWRMRAKA